MARSSRRVRPGQETFSDGRAPEDKSAGPWIFIPGAVLALAVGAVSYSQTGHYQQVQRWQQAVAQTPALLARVQDPKAQPLDEDELRRLALGLRTTLWQNPDASIEDWLMLGRLGRVLDNAAMATQAYARAYALAPENDRAWRLLLKRLPPDDRRRAVIEHHINQTEQRLTHEYPAVDAQG